MSYVDVEEYQASVYPESRFSVRDLSGVGDGILDVIAPVYHPKSWYDNLTSLQNQLAILEAGVSAVGQDVWDTIYANLFDAVNSGNAPIAAFDAYSTVMDNLTQSSSLLEMTPTVTPADYDIATATDRVPYYQAQLNYAKAVSPELLSKVQADQAQVKASVTAAGPIKSPSDAGGQAFVQSLQQRAEALGQSLIDWTKYLTWGIGGLLGIYALSKMGGDRRAA